MVLIGYLLLAAIVAVILFYAVIALLPDGVSMPSQADQRPFELPPDRRMGTADLAAVRIPVTLRGYRFAETDDLLDRLSAEIQARDEEIRRLRSTRETGDSSTNDSDMDGPKTAAPETHKPHDDSGSHLPAIVLPTERNRDV